MGENRENGSNVEEARRILRGFEAVVPGNVEEARRILRGFEAVVPGNVEEARRILRVFEAVVPGLAMMPSPHNPPMTPFPPIPGNVEEARRILRGFEAVVPGLAMVRLRRVSLERRHGRVAEAEELLLEAMRANEGLPLGSFYAVKLARQVCKVQKNLGKARKVLVEALEKDPENARLHANLLEMEFGADVGQNEGNTLSCFERALRSPLSDDAKLLFSQRRVEFLEDFGSSIHSLLKAYDEHQKILKAHAARKRPPENGSEEPEDKRLRPEDPSGLLGGPLGFGGGGEPNPSYSNYWYQQGYGSYGYQSPWNYGHYYGQS
ncbi:pre-mRNA-processing factor 39-like [Chiroxiphia lanceolata]|uniref:pre-mRNA-processing factor 39-like n=1 Tax=Chiroxiphia lanceolata TaxID=296741 RepID=UPI0013CF1A0A|nr:pre-mRNA-processing factor 39-like [Chiroxiphia lanceolata]